MLNFSQSNIQILLLTLQGANTLEQDMFALDAESSYTTITLETSNGDVQQTTSTSTHVEPVKEAPYGSAYFWTFRQYVRINKYVIFFQLDMKI